MMMLYSRIEKKKSPQLCLELFVDLGLSPGKRYTSASLCLLFSLRSSLFLFSFLSFPFFFCVRYYCLFLIIIAPHELILLPKATRI